MVPVVLDMRHEARYKDQINRPAAKDLVSYVNVAAFGIACDWHRHRTLPKPQADRRTPEYRSVARVTRTEMRADSYFDCGAPLAIHLPLAAAPHDDDTAKDDTAKVE